MVEIANIDKYTFEDCSLASYMEIGNTVNDIHDLMKHVGVKAEGKPRKHELAKSFSEYLLKNLKDIFDVFPLYDLMLLKALVEAGEHGIVEKRFNHIYPLVVRFSLVAYSRKKNDTTIKYIIPEDLRLALKENFETFKPTNEDGILWEHKQAAEGLVNLYGWIPYTELLKQMFRIFPMDSQREILRGVYASLSLREYMTCYDDDTILYSPYYIWGDDVNPLPKERKAYSDLGYKTFTLSEANTAGNAFFHGYENQEERELRDLLLNVAGVSEIDADAIIELIWQNVQLHCGCPCDAKRYLTLWFDPDKYPEVSTAAKCYVDSLPHWYLKGHTRQELYDIRNKKTVSQQPRNPFFLDRVTAPIINADKKIRPNDPCPCGSGKKYKKCCGKIK